MSTVNVNRVVDASGGVLAPISSVMRNRIINGAMVIDQRNAGALVAGATNNIYAVDRTSIGVFGGGTGRISGQRSTIVPSGAGFVNSLIATVTTADASPSAAFGYCLLHRIEGFNIADLGWGATGASVVTLSFWARSSLAGTYVFSASNSNNTRSYSATYTISTANTWQFITITIPGDTSGTWNIENGSGIQATWGLGGGTNRQAPSINSWGVPTSHVTDAAGCVDWIATNGATFYITGVQLEVGTQATSFEYRQYQQELALCQRYYYKIQADGTNILSFGTAFNTATTSTRAIINFPVSMRAIPTSLETTGTAANYSIRHTNTLTGCSTVPAFSGATSQLSGTVTTSVSSGLTQGQGSILEATVATTGFLAWSAEL